MMKCKLHTAGYTFPYLYDADQSVAQAYKAMCTPEFYVFDQRQELAYHGRFDESRPKNDKPVTGKPSRPLSKTGACRVHNFASPSVEMQQSRPIKQL